MQAYEAGLRPGETRLVLSPDSAFFRYFNNAAGRNASSPQAVETTPPATGTTAPGPTPAPPPTVPRQGASPATNPTQ